jgi:hypothetical protein
MSKSTAYLTAAARCYAKASETPAAAKEIQQLWLTIGETYSCLAEVDRREAAAREALSPPRGGLNGQPPIQSASTRLV